MNTKCFLKGCGVGMMVGGIVAIIVCPKQKKCRSGIGKALMTAGLFADRVSSMLGM